MHVACNQLAACFSTRLQLCLVMAKLAHCLCTPCKTAPNCAHTGNVFYNRGTSSVHMPEADTVWKLGQSPNAAAGPTHRMHSGACRPLVTCGVRKMNCRVTTITNPICDLPSWHQQCLFNQCLGQTSLQLLQLGQPLLVPASP
jgi:hypothetical protein